MRIRHLSTTSLLTLAAALSACSQPEATPSSPTTTAAHEPHSQAPADGPDEHLPQSPMTARLRGPDKPPPTGEIEVHLDLTRSRSTLAPISVSLTLPAGAERVAGEASESITDTTATALTRAWRIRYDAVPKGDLEVTVDWRTDAAGFRAKLPYRFGRPEPKAPEPERMPTETKLPGGTSLGRPIITR